MAARLFDPSPRYAPPELVPPPASGYVHIAAAIAPPAGPPFVRPNASRTALLGRLNHLAARLEAVETVARATVYRAVLIPSLGAGTAHPARYDVAVLIETASPQTLGDLQAAPPYEHLLSAITDVSRDVHVMTARCVRSLGEVDRARGGLFLFNHFTPDTAGGITPEAATELWEHLAGWYVAETGLDNSTLLAPIGQADYVLVNHARWDKSLPRLAAEQFGKPTFHTSVRAGLRAHHVVTMPVLYRLA